LEHLHLSKVAWTGITDIRLMTPNELEEREKVVSSEDEDYEEDDEDDEEEPLLKYSTINPVKDLLASQRDAASCITVMNDLIVSLFHSSLLILIWSRAGNRDA
jgi:hypothetical protein